MTDCLRIWRRLRNIRGKLRRAVNCHEIEVFDARNNPRRVIELVSEEYQPDSLDPGETRRASRLPGAVHDGGDYDNIAIDPFVELLSQAADRLLVRKQFERGVDSINQLVLQKQKTLEDDKMLIRFLETRAIAMPDLKTHLENLIAEQPMLEGDVEEIQAEQRRLKRSLEKSRREFSAHMETVYEYAGPFLEAAQNNEVSGIAITLHLPFFLRMAAECSKQLAVRRPLVKIRHCNQAIREEELIQQHAKDFLDQWRKAQPGYPEEHTETASSDSHITASDQEPSVGGPDSLIDGWNAETSIRRKFRHARRDLGMAKRFLRTTYEERSRRMAQFFFMHPQATMEAWKEEYRKGNRLGETFEVQRDQWLSFARETGEEYEKQSRAAKDNDVENLPFLTASLATRDSDAQMMSAPQEIKRSVLRHMKQSNFRRRIKCWRRRVARETTDSRGSDDERVQQNLRSRGEPPTLPLENTEDRIGRLSRSMYGNQIKVSLPNPLWQSVTRSTPSNASDPVHSGLGGVQRKALNERESLRRVRRGRNG